MSVRRSWKLNRVALPFAKNNAMLSRVVREAGNDARLSEYWSEIADFMDINKFPDCGLKCQSCVNPNAQTYPKATLHWMQHFTKD
jgi:hypothetical protein